VPLKAVEALISAIATPKNLDLKDNAGYTLRNLLNSSVRIEKKLSDIPTLQALRIKVSERLTECTAT